MWVFLWFQGAPSRAQINLSSAVYLERADGRKLASLVLLPCPVNSAVSWTLNFLPSTQDAHQAPALFLLSESQPGRSHLVYFLWFVGLCPTLLDGQWYLILAEVEDKWEGLLILFCYTFNHVNWDTVAFFTLLDLTFYPIWNQYMKCLSI